MLKFSHQVVFKLTGSESIIVSFAHDHFISVQGPLIEVLPMLKDGTTEDAMLAKLQSDDRESLHVFLKTLSSLGMLESTEYQMPHRDYELDLKSLGQVKVELFPLQDPIFAPYKVDEA